MRRTDDWSKIDWLRTALAEGHASNDPQLRVCQRLPASPCALKILHPIFEDPTITDREMTWDEAGEAEGVRGRRILWRELAEWKGLQMCPEISEWSFLPHFGRGWPRWLVGPDEGTLDREHCRCLAGLIEAAGLGGPCSFFFALPATTDWESEQVWQGELAQLEELLDSDEVWCSPTLWVPDDRSWCIATDYELSFTLVCGPDALLETIEAEDLLETVRVTSETRLDSSADGLNRLRSDDDDLVSFG